MAITDFFSRLFATRKATNNGIAPPIFPSPPIAYNSGEGALQIDTVYACVARYANIIASLPKLVINTANGEQDKGELYRLLNVAPNEYMDAPVFWRYIVRSVLLTGNAYVYIDRSNGLRLIPLPTGDIRDIKLHNIEGKYVKTFYVNDKIIYDQDMLHFMGEAVSPDGLRGLSAIQRYAVETLNHSIMVDRYAHEAFRKGANISAEYVVPHVLGPEEEQQLNEKLAAFGGNINSGCSSIIVSDGGKKLNNLSIQPDDVKFITSQKYTVERIARIFAVPLHVIGSGEQTSYSSNESSYSVWKEIGLQPMTHTLSSQATRKLLTDPFDICFDYDDLLSPNQAERYNAYNKACGLPFRTVNEVRQEEGLPPLPDEQANKLFVPGNISNPNGLMNNGGANDGSKV